jgi:hypothetical protein
MLVWRLSTCQQNDRIFASSPTNTLHKNNNLLPGDPIYVAPAQKKPGFGALQLELIGYPRRNKNHIGIKE